MKKHEFNFAGGEELRHVGVSWFVSYCFYSNIDTLHDNWKKVKTSEDRKKKYYKTQQYWRKWLHEIYQMSDKKLLTNKIGLSPLCIKIMAISLLSKQNLK